MASSPAPPSPHPGIPSPSALPSPQYSLLHFCSFILLSLPFFYHLALIFFVIFSTLGAFSSLISPSAPPPPSPAPYRSILYCFSPSPTHTFSPFFSLSLRFSSFPPAGNWRQLVCLDADCTHARPKVETDTPPQGALDFVLPCCGTDLLTKVWGRLCASRQSAQSAERVNFW